MQVSMVKKAEALLAMYHAESKARASMTPEEKVAEVNQFVAKCEVLREKALAQGITEYTSILPEIKVGPRTVLPLRTIPPQGNQRKPRYTYAAAYIDYLDREWLCAGGGASPVPQGLTDLVDCMTPDQRLGEALAAAREGELYSSTGGLI